jgi:hypothetical protein
MQGIKQPPFSPLPSIDSSSSSSSSPAKGLASHAASSDAVPDLQSPLRLAAFLSGDLIYKSTASFF